MIALRGLRRGEDCAPRWIDYSKKSRSLEIATQLVQDGWEILEGLPKTNSGIRSIALDEETVDLIELRKVALEEEKHKWGDAW